MCLTFAKLSRDGVEVIAAEPVLRVHCGLRMTRRQDRVATA